MADRLPQTLANASLDCDRKLRHTIKKAKSALLFNLNNCQEASRNGSFFGRSASINPRSTFQTLGNSVKSRF
ncbi:MAG: hypothetical protein BJG00_017040 [Limnothrix sp. CACIAM 69d]|nr:MAG: hypothetical protein BJG00_017040 [Limnothrix sp. CACIAM 69d]